MREAERSRPSAESASPLGREIDIKARRKLHARREVLRTVWSGFGMFGIIGWSVAVPTVLGAALGRYLDRHHPGAHSWTLALLAAGIVVGCALAWHWVAGEARAIHGRTKTKDEDER